MMSSNSLPGPVAPMLQARDYIPALEELAAHAAHPWYPDFACELAPMDPMAANGRQWPTYCSQWRPMANANSYQ